MKQGWKEMSFAEICHSIEDGDWIEKKDQSNSGIRLIQTGNIGVGVYKDKTDKAKYISEDTFVRLKCLEVVEGDILISRLPEPVGRACAVPKLPVRSITAVDCSILKLKNCVAKSWFIYYTQSNDYFSKARKECSGTTRDRITRKKLSVITIPVPPLSEQQRIVDLLDAEFAKIDALKANAEKNLQNAKDLFQAALKKELEPKEGWKTKPLSQVVDLGTHISYGIVQPEEDIPNGVPIVRPMDLTTEILTSTTNLKRTKQSISEAYQRSILKGTEILMCVRGTTGIVSLSSIELKGCNTTRGIVPLCISDDKTRKFVYYVLRSESCQKYISEYTNGTALKQINIADVKNIPIVVAPYDEQATILYRLDVLNEKCKALQANYEKTLSLCDDLKQALLRKAFNGEI